MQHHPDVDLRWKVTHWRLSTHSAGGLTQLDHRAGTPDRQAAARLGAVTKGRRRGRRRSPTSRRHDEPHHGNIAGG
jgi:hypothetical protein